MRGLAIIGLVALLAACAPIVEHHGFVPTEDDLERLRIGVTTQEQVIETVGPPGLTGLRRDDALYYVSSEQRTLGPFAPQEISRSVVVLSFGTAGRLRNVEHFGLEDGRAVLLSRRVTDAPTSDISILDQLVGNVGRFDPSALID